MWYNRCWLFDSIFDETKDSSSVLSFLGTMTASLPGQSICARAHEMQIISLATLSTAASGASDKQEALAGAFHLHVN